MKADLVLVEWLDAHGPPDTEKSWYSPDEVLEHHEPSICFSVGWVLKKDNRGITLFGSVADDHDIGDASFIPAGMIKKITVLKKARKKR